MNDDHIEFPGEGAEKGDQAKEEPQAEAQELGFIFNARGPEQMRIGLFSLSAGLEQGYPCRSGRQAAQNLPACWVTFPPGRRPPKPGKAHPLLGASRQAVQADGTFSRGNVIFWLSFKGGQAANPGAFGAAYAG